MCHSYIIGCFCVMYLLCVKFLKISKECGKEEESFHI